MNCQQAHELHAYNDGELDVTKSLDFERHLQDCQACSQAYQRLRALHRAVSDKALRFQPSVDLQNRVRARIRKEGEAKRIHSSWRWLVPAMSLATVAILAWGLFLFFSRSSANDLLTQEIVSSHVRSMMENHQTDVTSTDQHTVKPWFNGRLDFSPPVRDLSAAGFPLVGGRLDYVDNRPVAALVYQRQQHYINIFVWPASGVSNVSRVAQVRQGYNLIHWTRSGMNYWAISDLNLAELDQLVQLLAND